MQSLVSMMAIFAVANVSAADVLDKVKHGYADHDGVKIHYAELGEGPLVVMIHGFPDYWYTWRHQMAGLADAYRVVAVDQRGYNLSDQPEGIEAYDMALLVGDIAAVIRHLGEDSAVIVGHDWGGFVAWAMPVLHPDRVVAVAGMCTPYMPFPSVATHLAVVGETIPLDLPAEDECACADPSPGDGDGDPAGDGDGDAWGCGCGVPPLA